MANSILTPTSAALAEGRDDEPMTHQPLAPYRSTPIFDEVTLPAALRREHRTKLGVWGVVRVHAGQLKLSFVDPPEVRVLGPGESGLLLPDQPHFVEPVSEVRMQVDFYDKPPPGDV